MPPPPPMCSWRLVLSYPLDFLAAGGVPVMDRDNVALIVVLEDVRSDGAHLGRYLVVANTHLLFNTKRGDVKMCQLHHLMHTVHEIYMEQVRGAACPSDRPPAHPTCAWSSPPPCSSTQQRHDEAGNFRVVVCAHH